MGIQTKKLELIKIIADIQNETLLERLQHFLKQLEGIKISNKSASISNEAAELLLKINEGLPEETQARYNSLLKKSVQGKLSEEGHVELLKLIPKVEKKYAERLAHLIQLAALWNCSVDEVMHKLGIEPPQVIHN